MKQINLSNKKLNVDEISKFDKENISSKCGKPFCGLWFSPAIESANYHQVSEWHNHVEFSFSKEKIANNYITKSNATYITKLTFKETTKALTVEQIKASFQNKATKQEIIKDFNLKNTENLVLKINSRKDLDIISETYPNWDEMPKKNRSDLWQYVTKNFVGCEFSENLFKTVNRLDNDLIFILDVPSFVAFSKEGFEFETNEQKITFNTFDVENNLENVI